MTHPPSHLIEVLRPFGSITMRAMFGGYGIYKDGVIIGVIAHNTLYLKTPLEKEPYYQSLGAEPFIYEGKNRPVKMSYWTIPANVMQDNDLLKEWVNTAYQTSSNKSSIVKKKSRK